MFTARKVFVITEKGKKMFKLDGMALLNEMFIADIRKKDEKTARLMQIFRNHGINAIDGLAMMMEIAAVFEKGDEE